ncbi:MAG: PhoH family protein, partial [Betaproteobacteria bacterium]|nr:PhoH family protein [Betaproteobacteria bacterium]
MTTLELDLQPVNNHRLANLCGVLDENLKQIERTLAVSIRRRGEHFSVEGEKDKTVLAAEILQTFYRNARVNLSAEDIHLGLVQALGQAVMGSSGSANTDGAEPQLRTRRPDLKSRSARQLQYLQQIQSHVITFGVGPAGTGKTYLAMASAVDALEREEVKRIVLVRPAVEAGEKLGFLPGDLNQKVDPYLRPLYDALYDLMSYERVGRLFERGIIEVAPLAFMRGR